MTPPQAWIDGFGYGLVTGMMAIIVGGMVLLWWSVKGR